MIKMVGRIAAGVLMGGLLASPALAQWQDAAPEKNRITLADSYAGADKFSRGVRENPTAGAQSDGIGLGNHSSPGKTIWFSYQTLPRGFNYETTINAMRNTVTFFKGATFDTDARSEVTLSSPGIGADIAAILVPVTLGNGDKRHCAVWRETLRGNSTILLGYFCGAKGGQPLDQADLNAFMQAITIKS